MVPPRVGGREGASGLGCLSVNDGVARSCEKCNTTGACRGRDARRKV